MRIGSWLLHSLMLAATLLAGGCSSLPPAKPASPSFALTDVSQTSLARIAARGAPTEPDMSGFRLLPEAPFAFEARVALIRRAERSVDVQYYLLNDDDIGLHLLRELRDAAKRGVRVRLLVDDIYAAGEYELFASLAAYPNVEVRMFNPLPSRVASLPLRMLFSLHEFGRINHRMHNKQLVADNSFAVSGGRNIANPYFMRSEEANFIDIDVLSSGPIVRQMSDGFDRYWNSDEVRPIGELVGGAVPAGEAARRRFDVLADRPDPDVEIRPRDVLARAAVGRELDDGSIERRWGRAKLFVDTPMKITMPPGEAYHGSVTEGVLAAFDQAHEGVLVVSPYFIPGERGMEMMKKGIASGGYVTIVTNSLGSTDEPLAYAAYARYRLPMLQAGVVIREIGPELSAESGRFGPFRKSISRLHAKLAVIDRKRLFIGSMNLDHRSADVNTETGLLIDSAALAGDYEELIGGIGTPGVNVAYRLRLNPADPTDVEWLRYGADGKDEVIDGQPGGHLLLRLRDWIMLPLVGEDLL